MSRLSTLARRGGLVTAAVGALAIATAGSAAAHHCYKTDWEERAYDQLARTSTPWLPMSELTAMLVGDIFGPECAVDPVGLTASWMAANGLEDEPLVHSRATVGSGAAYQGQAPKGFAYLGDADLEFLVGEVSEVCGPPAPPMG